MSTQSLGIATGLLRIYRGVIPGAAILTRSSGSSDGRSEALGSRTAPFLPKGVAGARPSKSHLGLQSILRNHVASQVDSANGIDIGRHSLLLLLSPMNQIAIG